MYDLLFNENATTRGQTIGRSSNKAQTMILDLKRTLILVALANQSSQKRTQLHIPY